MIIAEMWSESRTWISKGKTEEEAKRAILSKWNKEQDRFGLDNKYSTTGELEEHYDISIYDLTNDDCIVY